MTTRLHRHQLALLSDAGWQAVMARDWDEQARACLTHWAARRLPLVVTRQQQQQSDQVALGLPAPQRWGRRRIALAVPRTQIAWFDEFPEASALPRLRPLHAALKSLGITARIYGSHGWRLLTGLPDHLRDGSDLDLWLAAADEAQADEAAALLASAPAQGPRLDGELVFPDGRAVAWREWLAWRAGAARHLLVKTLHGSLLCEALEPA
ncbi:malonate decarboxylase holo-[acyl-carrier-protein] synthase [Paucibacter sp. R3-3]|uniref:Malonate decarboxylase holo-[acyl-carrier-protein] synthase n=1 Tax=Roseateles agri TaxID=3098619 RepID=A0ABU5DLR3_9BURK|nr:malonate decarboxylase holo-[acyl-carrier-protein] synthase [Paucibacter sp. R3-3]MDY0746671.1 malonate decarboxylase holo-[acyl-carrier-protein] synthase [Paucibacter sp. R3-3]